MAKHAKLSLKMIYLIHFLQFKLLLIFRPRNSVVSSSLIVFLSQPICKLRLALLFVAGIVPLVLSKLNVSLCTLNHLYSEAKKTSIRQF